MREGLPLTECDWLYITYGYPDIEVSGAGLEPFNGKYMFLGPDPISGRPAWRGWKGTLSSYKMSNNKNIWMLWTLEAGLQSIYLSLHDTPFPAALVFHIFKKSVDLWGAIVVTRE